MKYSLICMSFLISLLTGCDLKVASKIQTYSPVPGLQESNLYSIRVNHQDIWTEKLRTSFDLDQLPIWFTGAPQVNKQQELHLAHFSCQGAVKIQITIADSVDSLTIHPKSRNIITRIENNQFSFTLLEPDYLYIRVNNLPPLCLFADPLEHNIPDSTDSRVIYFGPGIHRPGMMFPDDGTTIYIAGGAVVYGGIETDGQSHIQVRGRGILDGDFKYNRMVKPENSSDILFDGIIIRNSRSWTNTIINCRDVTYRHIKVISFRPGGDGINPLGSQNVTIDHCFFRCTDDCIAIKSPDENHIVKNIQITNNTMIGYAFSDGCTIGFETNGPSISDVLVQNCDIIQARGGSRVDGHSAFSIICDGPAEISNIRYENIRVEKDVLKLFEIHITDGTKYGLDPPGRVHDIYLRNIIWAAEKPIILQGLDDQHNIVNVTFDSCRVAGQLLKSAGEDLFQINDYVENIVFR